MNAVPPRHCRRPPRGASRRFPGALRVVLASVLPAGLLAGCGGGGYAQPYAPKGQVTVEEPVTVVPDDSGISGVVAYDTTNWPGDGSPAPGALPHDHVAGPVRYSVIPPVGGDHNGIWMDCGFYPKPVPNERAVHDLEHGAVWITYQPDLPAAQLTALQGFMKRQSKTSDGERFVDLTPYPGIDSPIVISAWGRQLKVKAPDDPRLQQFVDTFRRNARYTPEPRSPCKYPGTRLSGTPEFS